MAFVGVLHVAWMVGVVVWLCYLTGQVRELKKRLAHYEQLGRDHADVTKMIADRQHDVETGAAAQLA